jgi:hypothetical protein
LPSSVCGDGEQAAGECARQQSADEAIDVKVGSISRCGWAAFGAAVVVEFGCFHQVDSWLLSEALLRLVSA